MFLNELFALVLVNSLGGLMKELCVVNITVYLNKGMSNPAPREFSHYKTHLNQLIVILRITGNVKAVVLELNSAGRWLPCSRRIVKP